MYPKAGTSITRKDALTQQWDLTEKVGDTIKKMLSETRPNGLS